MQYDSYEALRIVKFTDLVECWLPGPGRMGHERNCVMDTDFHFYKIKTVSEMGDASGCILQMYLIVLMYTF